ncbi:MAG TPA: hypothetical protein VGJ91_16335 [Polyangiaceae bacterium]
MSRFGRRPLVTAVALLACALLGYELLPRDETRITALLRDLCARMNQTKDEESLAALRQFLALALLPQVSVHAPELEQDLQGKDEVAARAHALLEGAPLSFTLNSLEVKVSGPLARAEAELLVAVRGGGEQRREVRHTRVRLAKHEAGWQIEAVEVDPIAPSEPEARP